VSHRRRVFELEPSFWWHVGLRDLVRSFVPDQRRLRVLDAGCGTGMLMKELSRRHQVVGIDQSAEDLAYSAERGLRSLSQATVEALPFADETFDVVLSLDVLYHAAVEDEVAALGEARRVLRRGGRLIVNLPAYESLRSEHDLVAQSARRYTLGAVRRKLSALGLEEERASYRVSFLLPLAVATRLFGKARRLLGRGTAAPRSDVRPLRPAVNEVLRAIQLLENRLVRRWTLPAGLSVFCVYAKP
jgi:SAM-dependent methyltransferase